MKIIKKKSASIDIMQDLKYEKLKSITLYLSMCETVLGEFEKPLCGELVSLSEDSD